jgi:hypothetical protein
MLFNQDKSQVILCYSFSCGIYCGGSYALKLKKTENGYQYHIKAGKTVLLSESICMLS